jgi:hypothetical protein
MDRGVDLTVAAPVEPVAVGLAELTGIGATPAARASLASLAKRAAPAISPPGFGPLTAAKLVEEQFTSAREAFARSLEPGRRGKVVLTVAAA